jgi:hypothetical protein
MAEIIALKLAKARADDPLFKAVWEMEADLRAIDEFADALTLVSETMVESPHANAINRLIWEVKNRAVSAEQHRQAVYRLTRSDRTTDV